MNIVWRSAGLALSVVVTIGGCGRATVLNPSPNDVLREENQKLRDETQRLSQQVKELETRLAERRARPDAAPSLTSDPEADGALPRVASVQIEGATEVVRTSSDPAAPATLRLWVLPRDGRGRFLQIVGRLKVGVACLQAGSTPVDIAHATFSPAEVRDAWRSGWMGSHYAFEVPLTLPPDTANCPLTISIRFDDALSGSSFADERRVAAPRVGTATIPAESSRP